MPLSTCPCCTHTHTHVHSLLCSFSSLSLSSHLPGMCCSRLLVRTSRGGHSLPAWASPSPTGDAVEDGWIWRPYCHSPHYYPGHLSLPPLPFFVLLWVDSLQSAWGVYLSSPDRIPVQPPEQGRVFPTAHSELVAEPSLRFYQLFLNKVFYSGLSHK